MFVQADSPTDEALQALLHKIITRLMKLLTRRGVLVEEGEGGSRYLADADADSDEARPLRPLQAAACTYRVAFGPRGLRLPLIRFHGVLAPNARLQALVVPHGPEQATGKSEQTPTEPDCAQGRSGRISSARLLKRVFQIDLEHCPKCGGQLKIIAAILEAPVTERVLRHPGLQARAPPRVPASGDLQQAA